MYICISLGVAIVTAEAHIMTNPLAKDKTLFSRHAMWVLFSSGFFFFFSFLSFSISKIVLNSQKTVYHCLLYYSGSPTELWGNHLILFS